MKNTDPHKTARQAYAERLNQTPLGKGDALEDALIRINQQTKPFQKVLLPQSLDYPSAKEMFRYTADKCCLRHGHSFVIDHKNREVFQNLVAYFFGFEEHTHFNLHKGIFLYGPVGVGENFFLPSHAVDFQIIGRK
jgi:predicted ATPase